MSIARKDSLFNKWGLEIERVNFCHPGLCLVIQSCQTLCDPMDCSPPGSSIHGIFQARILEWVAILQGNFLTQGLNLHLLHVLYWQADSLPLSHLGSQLLDGRALIC